MTDAAYSLLQELEKVKDKKHPPIHLWNPDNVKDIDMVIRRDGSWYYMGTPIERQRMVWLFSTVLRREDDGEYYLVTPVEKCRIQVEDAPFTAVLMDVTGEGDEQTLTFTTNVAERIAADAGHPIRVEIDDVSGEPSPYVTVREGLEALMARNVYYDLVELLSEEVVAGESWQGVWSGGSFFRVIRSSELD